MPLGPAFRHQSQRHDCRFEGYTSRWSILLRMRWRIRWYRYRGQDGRQTGMWPVSTFILRINPLILSCCPFFSFFFPFWFSWVVIRVLTFLSIFHMHCLLNWLSIHEPESQRNACPMCRTPLFGKSIVLKYRILISGMGCWLRDLFIQRYMNRSNWCGHSTSFTSEVWSSTESESNSGEINVKVGNIILSSCSW